VTLLDFDASSLVQAAVHSDWVIFAALGAVVVCANAGTPIVMAAAMAARVATSRMFYSNCCNLLIDNNAANLSFHRRFNIAPPVAGDDGAIAHAGAGPK
jgi:hypothetical protein